MSLFIGQKKKMSLTGFFFLVYFLALLFAVYVMIFGNNKCNRNTCIGSIYRFFAIKFPAKLNLCFRRVFHLKPPSEDGEDTCIGTGGPCRYFIIIFFAIMYFGLVLDYWLFTFPYIKYITKTPLLHLFFSIVLPCIPWAIVIALQYIDPGVVNAENVENYLKKYPYDHEIYFEKMCPTDHIPVVPRSRYCNYTHRRVAKYDHYCPWVLASIGERTHRFFLLFLISCVAASIHYCWADLKVVLLFLIHAYPKIKWTQSKATNALLIVVILMKFQLWNSAAIILFVVIIITLVVFILQQMYYISINKTQIELDKYESLAYKRKEANNNTPIVNHYNKGFIQNWKEFLFPTPVAKSKPWKPDKFWKKVIENEKKKQDKLKAEKEQQTTADKEEKEKTD